MTAQHVEKIPVLGEDHDPSTSRSRRSQDNGILRLPKPEIPNCYGLTPERKGEPRRHRRGELRIHEDEHS